MRRLIPVLVLVLVGACTATDDTASTSAAREAASSTTSTSTTTTMPAATATSTCDALKVAVFDFESSLGEVFSSANLAGGEELDAETEEQLGMAFAAALLGLYGSIGDIDAPAEIADELDTVASWVSEIEADIAAGESVEDAFSALEEGEEITTPEVAAAAEAVAVWTAEECGAEIDLDPETVLVGAVMGALTQAFGDLGELFEEGFEDLGEGFDGGTVADGTAITYGDDAELDALWDACAEGDGTACDDLYWSSFYAYELFSLTCGDRIDPRDSFDVDCERKLGEGGPQTYGDDGELDGLWDACEGGDAASCDKLYASSPLASEYEAFGGSCGDTRPEASVTPCEYLDSGEPYGYGDDPELDVLWDGCAAGDSAVCFDLFFDSGFGTAYETFGDICGQLVQRDEECGELADWLTEPANSQLSS